VNTLHVVAGVLPEGASLFVYSMPTRTVLPAPNRPPITTLVRIDLTTLGMNHVIPGGGATANALRYRLLTASGVSGADAVFGTVVHGVGSAIVLNAMLWLELMAAIPRYGLTHFFGVSAALFAAAATVVLGLTGAENWTIQRVRAIAAHLPRVSADGAERQVRQLAHHLTTFGSDRGLMVRVIVWAAMNWLLDAASLWVFVAAFGYHADVIGLLVAYGLANVLAVLPFTPGGLGIVEGVLGPALIAVGAPHGIAILGVLGLAAGELLAADPIVRIGLPLTAYRPAARTHPPHTPTVARRPLELIVRAIAVMVNSSSSGTCSLELAVPTSPGGTRNCHAWSRRTAARRERDRTAAGELH
jgi:uncharacterized membrane protein YbhN (UPF0104 family)